MFESRRQCRLLLCCVETSPDSACGLGNGLQGIAGATGSTGAAYAGNAFQNNYLSHQNVQDIKEALAELKEKCGSDGLKCEDYATKLNEILEDAANTSLANELALANCATRECINEHLEAAASFDELFAGLVSVSPDFAKIAIGFENQQLIAARENSVTAAQTRVAMLDNAESFKVNHCGGVWDAACATKFNDTVIAWQGGIETGETLQLLVLGGVAAGTVARSIVAAAAEVCGAANWGCITAFVVREVGTEVLAEFSAGGFTVATVAGKTLVSQSGKIVGVFDEAAAIIETKLPKGYRELGSLGAAGNSTGGLPIGYRRVVASNGNIEILAPDGRIYASIDDLPVPTGNFSGAYEPNPKHDVKRPSVRPHPTNPMETLANSVPTATKGATVEITKAKFGHTFERHGADSTKFLTEHARGSGQAQGQFLDDQSAAKFIQDNLDKVRGGPVSIPVPDGLQVRIINPDGSYSPARTIRLVPGGKGVKTAYPEP